MGLVDHVEIGVVTGDTFVVEGSLDEVERALSDAARSGQSRLAWFTEYGTEALVGIGPGHVVALRAHET